MIFGADMSSFVHVDNKRKDILNLRKSPTDGIGDTRPTPEKKCSDNFIEQNKIHKLFKFINLKKKTLKLTQIYYVYETFQNIFQLIIQKILDFMDMFIILALYKNKNSNKI